jgi:hypothetical protein
MTKRIALAVAVMLVLAAPSFAGVVYSAKTTGEGAKGAEMQSSTVRAWVSEGNAKVLFEASENPMTESGSYLITRDGGQTIYLVNPEDKTFAKWDLEAMMQLASGAMKMVNLKITDPKVEKLGESLGEPIIGVPTTHYKFRTSYGMQMKFFGMSQSNTIVQDEEIWSAPSLLDAGFGIWLRKSPPKTGDDQFDALMRSEMQKMNGFPLKRLTVTTTTDKNGKAQTTRTTMEVTEMQMVPIPASTFEIPPDYKETQLLPSGEGEEGEPGGENPLAGLFGKKKKSG